MLFARTELRQSAIGAGHRPRLLHEGFDVFLVHVERHDRCAALNEHIDGRVDGILQLHSSDFVEALTL